MCVKYVLMSVSSHLAQLVCSVFTNVSFYFQGGENSEEDETIIVQNE